MTKSLFQKKSLELKILMSEITHNIKLENTFF